MAANALVQTRIDPALKERATAVLDRMGLTVSDAVRILLTRIANDGEMSFLVAADPARYDAWFAAKVKEALDDLRPGIPHAEVEARLAQARAELADRPSAEQRAEARAAAERILARSLSLTLGDITLKELISEGRA